MVRTKNQRSEMAKAAKTAMRIADNEAIIIACLSGVAVFFGLVTVASKPFENLIGQSVDHLFGGIGFSLITGLGIGVGWYLFAKRTIEAAQAKHNRLMRLERDKRAAETEAKIAAMKVADRFTESDKSEANKAARQ